MHTSVQLSQTLARSVPNINVNFIVLQLALETFPAPINIRRITLDMPAHLHATVHVSSPLLLPNFKQNYNQSPTFSKTHQHQTS
jgi:hypothetical protein